MIDRVQPRVRSTKHHLPNVIKTMMDVKPRMRGRLDRSRRRTAHDRETDPVETVQGVEQGDGVRTGVGTDEDESVVGLWDEGGPFEVGACPVEGVVGGFFGDERAGGCVRWDGEVEELECGVVLDVDWVVWGEMRWGMGMGMGMGTYGDGVR